MQRGFGTQKTNTSAVHHVTPKVVAVLHKCIDGLKEEWGKCASFLFSFIASR